MHRAVVVQEYIIKSVSRFENNSPMHSLFFSSLVSNTPFQRFTVFASLLNGNLSGFY